MNTARTFFTELFADKPKTTIDAAVKQAMAKPEVRGDIERLLRSEAQHAYRWVVRGNEDRAAEDLAAGVDWSSAQKNLLGNKFPLRGRFIEWNKATAQQHRERGEFHMQFSNTHAEKAQLHFEAADAIEKAGVQCLADLK